VTAVPEREPITAAMDVAIEVRRSVTRLARRLRAERVDHGVPSSHVSVLGHLLRCGTLTASAIAELERVQPQSVTRILAELESGGLIRRDKGTVDRRQFLITITEAGRDLLVRDAQRQDSWLAATIGTQLTEAERDLLGIAARLLARLAA
jgi:DNA-binding MarR family transcriptional regulator